MKFKALCVVAIVVGAFVCGVIPAGTAIAAPREETPPTNQISIVRDSHGEPHIYAPTAAAAMYGFGYAQMQDQAAYVLTSLYTAIGRSAEVEGPACAPNLNSCFQSDQFTHLFQVPEAGIEKFGQLSPDDQARYWGFAEGINAYVRDHPSLVPAWAVSAPPVSGADIVAEVEYPFVMAQLNRASKGGVFNFPTTVAGSPSGCPSGATAAARADSDRGPQMIDLLEDPTYQVNLPASNMFAVNGTKTASGKPILDSDPHLGWNGATQWYQAQLTYPGVSVEGAGFRGMPGIGIGYNGYVAWGHTSNQGNLHEQDAYKETLGCAPDTYAYGGDTKQMTVRTVDIKVQTAPGTIETVPVRFRYTIHGPVVTDPPAGLDGTQAAPGTSFAGSVTASQYMQVGLASELWREAEAHSVDQFKQAMSNVQLSQYNTLVADSGNIWYIGSTRSGVLNPGVPYNQQPLDGSNPNNTWVSSDPNAPWTGIIPIDQLPQAENPPSGFYENANNNPWTVAPGQIQQSDLPYYMQGGNDGTRSRRQRDLLTPAQHMTLADADTIAFDDFVEFAPELKLLLDQAAAAPGADSSVVAGSQLLDGWNNEADPNSTAVPLFIAWSRALNPAALGVNPQQASASYPDGLVGQPGGFTTAQVNEAARAMQAAAAAMTQAYGTIAVRYGDVHTIDIGDFDSGIGGGTNDAPTLWLTGCKNSFPPSQLVAFPCSTNNGSSYMMDVDLGSGTMHVAKPVADTDDPSSPFYTPNAQDFTNRTFRTFPTTYAAVLAEKTSETDLPLPQPPPAKCATPPGDPALVRLAYLRLLGRCPDPSGLTYWTAFLTAGHSATEFATAIAASPERLQALIERSYHAVFNRAADPGGLKFWTTYLENGGRFDNYVAFLAGSSEITSKSYPNDAARVQVLYQIVLNRPGDPNGVSYWANRLAHGATPAELASLLAHSTEFASDVVGATPTQLATFGPGVYQEVLLRAPDTGGLTFWTRYFSTYGVSYGIEGLFGGSAEFYSQAQSFPEN